MTSQNQIKDLISKKDNIESQIQTLSTVLESQQHVGLHEKLVDSEGFPRADIDVFSVRHARQNIIRLQNDHKAIMKEIEEGLHKIHANAKQTSTSSQTSMEVDQNSDFVSKADFSLAFARVDRVDKDSPALDAGLEVNDLITQFGSITKDNFQSLQTIGSVVQHSKDTVISVTVIRKGELIHLALTPKIWSGRGLLGCNILPVK